MAVFKAKVTGGETCPHCKGVGSDPAISVFVRWCTHCPLCRGHARLPYQIDLRGYGGAGSVVQIPDDVLSAYDHYLTDPPDNRSTMIRLLDDPAWRESLAAAETPLSGLYRKEYGPFFGGFFW